MNDRSHSDLDHARETIDELAQHVDTTAAWNAVEAAVEALPRTRARRRMQLAAATIAVVTIAGGLALALRSGAGRSAVEVTEPSTTLVPAACALTLPDKTLAGPAASALHGGAAREPFELDGGRFSMVPPRPGDAPLVSASEAECAALASSNGNGYSLHDLAARSAAIGYGRVSIAPEVIANAQDPSDLAGQTNHDTHPTLPDATPYHDRLAWVVVVDDPPFVSSGGPMIPAGPTRTTVPASTPARPGYTVFVVDAQTGSDALIYTEGQSTAAGGYVIVPAERVSVPWTLVSRSPNGYSGEISATVLPCDGYPNPVFVDRDRAAVSVVVERPVSPSCGDPKQVTIPLVAASATSDLPDEIDHGSLGPDVTPQSSGAPPPRDDGRELRQVTDADNGTTITVTVGSVFYVGPLHVSGKYAADMAVSSDSDVLGTLPGWSDYEIGSFRAWRPGHADLVVPASGCAGSGSASCAPLWILHVNVT
jgi:hypothetical protein